MIRFAAGVGSGESPIKAHAAASVMSQNLDASRMSPGGQIVANTVRVGINELTPVGAATKVFGGIDPYSGQSLSGDQKVFEAAKGILDIVSPLNKSVGMPDNLINLSEKAQEVLKAADIYQGAEAANDRMLRLV